MKIITKFDKFINEDTNEPIKKGDIVGNSVQGFDFEVVDMKPGLHGLKVKNLITGEVFDTTYQNMRKKRNQEY